MSPVESQDEFVEIQPSAKAAHVNMMTDTIIANMPQEGLRSILRGVLGVDPKVTTKLNTLAIEYLAATKPASVPQLFISGDNISATPAFFDIQQRYRCLMGCGKGFESMELLAEVVHQVQISVLSETKDIPDSLMDMLAIVDADVVQSVTAVQKELLAPTGSRKMESEESKTVITLFNNLNRCKQQTNGFSLEFPFDRGFSRIQKLDDVSIPFTPPHALQANSTGFGDHNKAEKSSIEMIQLGKSRVPRMFMGLWQFSSPAWGTASISKIHRDFRKHVDAGFTAYDMADHYGDAEVTFGLFRSKQPDAANIICATKYCIFEPVTITEEVIRANITERLVNIGAESIDLLQLHWQDYNDLQYIKMAQLVSQDSRVLNTGLCNFDTQRMNEIISSGVPIVSNQVQFSLIDLRPTFRMADSCRKHDIKLLTYGSLCGGFLAQKWLNKPTPNLFDIDMTPSHRKYIEMIKIWGGWTLFQSLLAILSSISIKHNVSVSNVATRWVLDHDYVGAVIIGGRMGISEHVEENLKVFGWRLDEDDQRVIRELLEKSQAKRVFECMGDCGAEYRQ